jgi:hypothetical protein
MRIPVLIISVASLIALGGIKFEGMDGRKVK